MSYHILHILSHGSMLARDRGHLVCRPAKDASDARERRMALEDIRAVVIAARGVTLTSSAVSGILGHEGIILHCDEAYRPVGVTVPLPRTIDPKAFLNQTRQPKPLNERLWNGLLRGKTQNQRAVLAERKLFSEYLDRAAGAPRVDEGNAARKYWQLFFPAIGWASSGRDRRLDNPPNQMLNYGYTVLATLCHRSIVIHGLLPMLGVGHRPGYRNDPLVYDLMEPYRPFVDRLLAEFMVQPDISMEAWCRAVGNGLREVRVAHDQGRVKLMDAIDFSVRSLVECYRSLSSKPLWIPAVPVGEAA